MLFVTNHTYSGNSLTIHWATSANCSWNTNNIYQNNQNHDTFHVYTTMTCSNQNEKEKTITKSQRIMNQNHPKTWGKKSINFTGRPPSSTLVLSCFHHSSETQHLAQDVACLISSAMVPKSWFKKLVNHQEWSFKQDNINNKLDKNHLFYPCGVKWICKNFNIESTSLKRWTWFIYRNQFLNMQAYTWKRIQVSCGIITWYKPCWACTMVLYMVHFYRLARWSSMWCSR